MPSGAFEGGRVSGVASFTSQSLGHTHGNLLQGGGGVQRHSRGVRGPAPPLGFLHVGAAIALFQAVSGRFRPYLEPYRAVSGRFRTDQDVSGRIRTFPRAYTNEWQGRGAEGRVPPCLVRCADREGDEGRVPPSSIHCADRGGHGHASRLMTSVLRVRPSHALLIVGHTSMCLGSMQAWAERLLDHCVTLHDVRTSVRSGK